MGEPGTKELISLEELEAAGSLRTGRKHILSILVENKPGVLTRVAGLFARRAFNIDTLAVGPTDDPTISRITLTLDGAMHPIDQVTKQLHKLVNVLKIRDLEPEETLARELALFKLAVDGAAARRGHAAVRDLPRGSVVDVAKRSLVVEVTGTRRQDRGVRGARAAVRADRDGAHGRDRDLPRARRDLRRRRSTPRMSLTRTRPGERQWLDPAARELLAARLEAAVRRARARRPARRSRRSRCAAPGVDPSAVVVASRRAGRAVVLLRAARPRRRRARRRSAACARGSHGARLRRRTWHRLSAPAARRRATVGARAGARSRRRVADPPDGPAGAGLVAVGGFAFAPQGAARAAVGGLRARLAARARGRARAARRATCG